MSERTRILVICFLAWTFTNLDQSLFGYTIPSLMREFSITLDQIGLILSGSFVFAIFSTIAVGLFADRFGRRIALAGCLFLSALAVGLTGAVVGIFTLFLARALGFGLSNGLSPVTGAYVSEASPARWRGLFMGLLMCGFPLGWFLASLIAAPLLESHGWRAVFFCAFAVAPIAVAMYFLLPESAYFERAKAAGRTATPWRITLAELFGPAYRARTLLCALAFFSYGGAYAGTAFYFPSFFQAVRGYSEADAARIVGLAYGVGVFGYIAAALVGEYLLTRRNTAIIWCWLGALCLGVLVWLPRTYWQDILAFGSLATFFYGASAVMLTIVTEQFPTRLRATAVAVSASAGLNLGFAVYPFLVARLVGYWGWQEAFTIMIAPSLVLSGIFLLWLPNLRSARALEIEDA